MKQIGRNVKQYFVKVKFRTMDTYVSSENVATWGCFSTREEAERCMIVLAGRADTYSASIGEEIAIVWEEDLTLKDPSSLSIPKLDPEDTKITSY